MEEKDTRAGGENDSFSAMLDGILSNPEMLSMISSMADKLKSGTSAAESPAPQEGSSEGEAHSEAEPTAQAASGTSKLPDMLGTLAPLLSTELSKSSPQNDHRACLLRALKPYLSSGRCEAIEYIIKFSRLSEILKNLS